MNAYCPMNTTCILHTDGRQHCVKGLIIIYTGLLRTESMFCGHQATSVQTHSHSVDKRHSSPKTMGDKCKEINKLRICLATIQSKLCIQSTDIEHMDRGNFSEGGGRELIRKVCTAGRILHK